MKILFELYNLSSLTFPIAKKISISFYSIALKSTPNLTETEILCIVLEESELGLLKTKLLAETRPLLKDVRIQN